MTTGPERVHDESTRTIGSIILAAITLAMPALLLPAMGLLTPKLRATFADFDVPISAGTQLALGPVLPLTLGVILLFTFAKEFLHLSRRLVNVWNLVALLVVGVIAAFYILAVLPPYLSVARSLQ